MATTTPNLGLKKPDISDFIDIQNFNDNFDKLDKSVLKDGTVALDNLTVGTRAVGSTVGTNSTVRGVNVTASGSQTHAEGYGTVAGPTGTTTTSADATAGNFAHAEGNGSKANGNSAHAEGKGTIAGGVGAHSEGILTTVGGAATGGHAEGVATQATLYAAHSEGYGTVAGTGTSTTSADITAGYYSHAEGNGTRATGNSSHAEGKGTIASGQGSHVEGGSSVASGIYSHAEGNTATASGGNSHAEGGLTTASGNNSHAGGYGTIAAGESQTAIGKYNVSDTTSLFKVGMGTADAARADALKLDGSGNLEIAGAMAGKVIQSSGSANAITLPFAPLTHGNLITFIASNNNNGADTTINGVRLYKPGGTTAPTLIAGKAYTVWYNSGVGGSFFIKASAEGTASADKVLAGYTFSNDADTGLTGTLAPSGIKSVQSGDASIAAGYQILQTTISAVNTSNSVVIIQNAGNETQTSVQHLCVLGELINSTTLSLVRVGTSGEAKVTWTVIEFENLKSLQTGTLQTTGGPGSFQTASITTVVPSKTMVFASFKTVDLGTFATLGAGAIRARLWDESSVSVAREVGGFGTVTVRWYVVEFK